MSDRTRKILKFLRIAWTAFFSAATMLLCVLWWRSYRAPGAYGHISHDRVYEAMFLQNGALRYVRHYEDGTRDNGEPTEWSYVAMRPNWDSYSFMYSYVPDWEFELRLPFRFLVPVSFISTIVLWRWWQLRFSLRTLLIVTTLVAVVLGVLVYAMK